MHTIEPFFNWRHAYIASEDNRSPFFGHTNSEIEFTDKIYDHLIHPQWDSFGSSTLFIKNIYTNYDMQFAIFEFIGEWNDCLYNDIMFLKRNVIDPMVREGIKHFILIGENVLNYHASDDSYYEEWFDDIEDGWITLINFRDHVQFEMQSANLDYFLMMDERLQDVEWRTFNPNSLFQFLNSFFIKRLQPSVD